MKNKVLIVILLIMFVILVGLIYKTLPNNNVKGVSVELFCRDMSQPTMFKYDKIELTSEQENKIKKFYKRTNTKRPKDQVQLLFLGEITLKFSNGNTLVMDANNDNYARYNNAYNISISKEFKDYVLDLIKNNKSLKGE